MKNLVVDNDSVNLRADGRLQNLSDWAPDLAEQMAQAEGLVLTEQHWDVLNIMREYYQKYNISPILKLLRREVAKQYSADRASIDALEALFPGGVQNQGSRLAGVPMAQLDAELDQSQRVQSVKSAQSRASSDIRHFNDQFEFEGRNIKVYATGNLANLEDWNEKLAVVLAEKEGIHLTDEHWVVLNFLRGFYFKYGVAPMVKILIKHMSEELGKEAANKDKLYELFPGGPASQGSRIGGLPSPQGCIDG